MVEVYYYIPAEAAENIVECGLKLSQWYDREVPVNGELRKCLSALLNPKDDIEKFKSEELKCIKLEIAPNYCFVADRWLYEAGLDTPEVMELYIKSVIPVNDYIFGTYRLPECLVTSTVIGGHISLLDKRRDSPVLFNNSEELYINNIIEGFKEEHPEFNDTLLYYFYLKLAESGKARIIEDRKRGIAVFISNKDEKACTIRIPDIEAY